VLLQGKLGKKRKLQAAAQAVAPLDTITSLTAAPSKKQACPPGAAPALTVDDDDLAVTTRVLSTLAHDPTMLKEPRFRNIRRCLRLAKHHKSTPAECQGSCAEVFSARP
jgi:hypothetical protein